MDLGNLVGAVLVLGQFVSDKEFSTNLFATGIVVMVICYIISYIVSS